MRPTLGQITLRHLQWRDRGGDLYGSARGRATFDHGGRDGVTVHDYGTVFRRRKEWVVLGLVIGLLGGLLFALLGPRDYRTAVSVYFAPQNANGDVSNAYDGSMLAAQRAASYAPFLTSSRVTDDVIANLALDMSPADLRDEMSVVAEPGSTLVTATVTDRSPARAATIANSVAESFVNLVAGFEQPAGSRTPPSVRAEIVEPAPVPLQPTAPVVPLSLGLGALLGLMVGCGGALVRQATDTKITTAEDLESVVRHRILAEVPADEALDAIPLVDQRRGLRTVEAFRRLRLGIEQADQGAAHPVLLVVSANVGEGRTTTATNIALALAADDRRVVLVDGDLRNPRVAETLGMDASVGVTSVLAGRCGADEALQRRGSANLWFLAAGPAPDDAGEVLSSRSMVPLLDRLRSDFDAVVVDSPPAGSTADTAALARASDAVLLVVQSGATARRDVRAVVADLGAVSARVIGTVLTCSARDRLEVRRAAEVQTEAEVLPGVPDDRHADAEGTVVVEAQRIDAEPGVGARTTPAS